MNSLHGRWFKMRNKSLSKNTETCTKECVKMGIGLWESRLICKKPLRIFRICQNYSIFALKCTSKLFVEQPMKMFCIKYYPTRKQPRVIFVTNNEPFSYA